MSDVHVGYHDAFSRMEYGLFVDRTAKGLGYSLVQSGTSLPMIEMAAEGMDEATLIRQRRVTCETWEPIGVDEADSEIVARAQALARLRTRVTQPSFSQELMAGNAGRDLGAGPHVSGSFVYNDGLITFSKAIPGVGTVLDVDRVRRSAKGTW